MVEPAHEALVVKRMGTVALGLHAHKRYLDRAGQQRELAAEGLLAPAIQHEINHLDGKLIIDFLSQLKRDIVVRKFKKQARAAEAL